jgi:hypothetical protein
MHHLVKDISGQKFNRLTAIKLNLKKTKSRNKYWDCICDCGNIAVVSGASLRNGDTKSCGCFQKEKARLNGERSKTHGMSNTSTYAIWDTMIARCHRETSKDYKRYGAKGIKVCERWRVFDVFLADMGVRPKKMSIDRIDNTKGYSPENCRWATAKQQVYNSSAVRLITINNRTQCIADWCKEIGIATGTVAARIFKGMSPEIAITTPVKNKIKKSCCETMNYSCNQGRTCPARLTKE